METSVFDCPTRRSQVNQRYKGGTPPNAGHCAGHRQLIGLLAHSALGRKTSARRLPSRSIPTVILGGIQHNSSCRSGIASSWLTTAVDTYVRLTTLPSSVDIQREPSDEPGWGLASSLTIASDANRFQSGWCTDRSAVRVPQTSRLTCCRNELGRVRNANQLWHGESLDTAALLIVIGAAWLAESVADLRHQLIALALRQRATRNGN